MSDAVLDAPYSRLTAYFIAEFIIRTVLPVMAAFDNDYEAALIWLVITTQNTQNLMMNQSSRRRYASFRTEIPEIQFRPVSRLALSRSTNLPRETVRRKVAKLLDKGYVRETPRGLIVPSQLREIPLYTETLAVQEANLRRLFSMVRDVLASDPVVIADLWSGLAAAR